MFRIIILLIVVFLFLTFSFPIIIYEAILGKIDPAKRDKSALAWAKWAFGVVIFLSGTKITVKGIENIPTDRSVLYIGNHQSYFDIIINYLYVEINIFNFSFFEPIMIIGLSILFSLLAVSFPVWKNRNKKPIETLTNR